MELILNPKSSPNNFNIFSMKFKPHTSWKQVIPSEKQMGNYFADVDNLRFGFLISLLMRRETFDSIKCMPFFIEKKK
jgi:hypothetical protein